MPSTSSLSKPQAVHHETRWSLVARAVSDEEASVKAMDELLRIYLPVLKGMLNRWPQLDASTKEDLLQSFVHKRILEKQLLGKADASKGVFVISSFAPFKIILWMSAGNLPAVNVHPDNRIFFRMTKLKVAWDPPLKWKKPITWPG